MKLKKHKYKLLLFILSFFIAAAVAAQQYEQYDTTAIVEEPQDEEEQEIRSSGITSPFKKRYFSDSADAVDHRKVSENFVTTLKKQDAFWYADSAFNPIAQERKKKEEAEGPKGYKKEGGSGSDREYSGRSGSWLSTPVLVAILAIFIAALTFYLIKSNIVSRKRITTADDKIIEEDNEDIFAINYQKDIDKAIKDQNYRLAIRLMFLRVLRNLSDRNIIQYKIDKTNFDYLVQLHKTGYYNDFFKLTRSFEYTWYGKFPVAPETFTVIKKDFENFDKKLH